MILAHANVWHMYGREFRTQQRGQVKQHDTSADQDYTMLHLSTHGILSEI